MMIKNSPRVLLINPAPSISTAHKNSLYTLYSTTEKLVKVIDILCTFKATVPKTIAIAGRELDNNEALDIYWANNPTQFPPPQTSVAAVWFSPVLDPFFENRELNRWPLRRTELELEPNRQNRFCLFSSVPEPVRTGELPGFST